MYEVRTPDMSTWQGRKRRGERCHHSFAHFVALAKRTKEGKSHLARHHGGYNGKSKEKEDE